MHVQQVAAPSRFLLNADRLQVEYWQGVIDDILSQRRRDAMLSAIGMFDGSTCLSTWRDPVDPCCDELPEPFAAHRPTMTAVITVMPVRRSVRVMPERFV